MFLHDYELNMHRYVIIPKIRITHGRKNFRDSRVAIEVSPAHLLPWYARKLDILQSTGAIAINKTRLKTEKKPIPKLSLCDHPGARPLLEIQMKPSRTRGTSLELKHLFMPGHHSYMKKTIALSCQKQKFMASRNDSEGYRPNLTAPVFLPLHV